MKASAVLGCVVAAISVSCQSAGLDGPPGMTPQQPGQMSVPNITAPAVPSGVAGMLASVPVGGMSSPVAVSGSAAVPMSAPDLPAAGSPGVPASREDEIAAMRDPAKDAWMGFGGSLEQTFARPSATVEKSNLAMLGKAWEKMAPGGVTGTLLLQITPR